MMSHKKKIMVLIIVCAIVIFFFAVYFGILIKTVSGFRKWLLAIILLAIIITLIKVGKERVKEIRKGEEDDISKY